MKYRIEIKSKFDPEVTFFFWIGSKLELVSDSRLAIECTEEQSLEVMERIGCEATCFAERNL